MESWEERTGRNEALFREVNESIRALQDDRVLDLVCECGDAGCVARLEVPLAVYEQVRGDARLFVVAPGHQVPAVETVAAEHATFFVVRKQGASARVAEQTDPRSDAVGLP